MSQDFVVRIVDKGAGQLWDFCRQWAWDATGRFLEEGGYESVQQEVSSYMAEAVSNAKTLGCPVNPKAKITHMYLIGKVKSVWAGKGWLWRPIAAAPEPVIAKSKLNKPPQSFRTRLSPI